MYSKNKGSEYLISISRRSRWWLKTLFWSGG